MHGTITLVLAGAALTACSVTYWLAIKLAEVLSTAPLAY